MIKGLATSACSFAASKELSFAAIYSDCASDTFRFKGAGIYLRKSEKEYLARWVLMGNKDNSKRILLCKMRKRFGKDFMQDVDRKGNYTGRNTDA